MTRALWCVYVLFLILLCNGGEVSVNLRLGEDVEPGAVLGHHGHLQPIKRPSQSIIQWFVQFSGQTLSVGVGAACVLRAVLWIRIRIEPHWFWLPWIRIRILVGNADFSCKNLIFSDQDPNPDPGPHWFGCPGSGSGPFKTADFSCKIKFFLTGKSD